MSVGQVCSFHRWQRGFRIPSSAVFGKIGLQYVKNIERFAKQNNIPMVVVADRRARTLYAGSKSTVKVAVELNMDHHVA